jgi:hypothetical protein
MVQFTQGRDLKLAPAQEGAPLNYFVYPYVEIGGKEYPNVSIAFSFEDVGEKVGKRFALVSQKESGLAAELRSKGFPCVLFPVFLCAPCGSALSPWIRSAGFIIANG